MVYTVNTDVQGTSREYQWSHVRTSSWSSNTAAQTKRWSKHSANFSHPSSLPVKLDIMSITQHFLAPIYTFYLFTISDTLGVMVPPVRWMHSLLFCCILNFQSSRLQLFSLVQLAALRFLWPSYGFNSISWHLRKVLTGTKFAWVAWHSFNRSRTRCIQYHWWT